MRTRISFAWLMVLGCGAPSFEPIEPIKPIPPSVTDRPPPPDEVGDPPKPNPDGPTASTDTLPSDRYRTNGILELDRLAGSAAEVEVWRRLGGRDGWPTDVSLFFPWSEPAMARVVLVDVDAAATVSTVSTPTARGLRATPSERLRPGTTYVYALTSSSLRPASTTPIDPTMIEQLGRNVPDATSVVAADRFTTSGAVTPRFDVLAHDMAIPNDLLRTDGRWPTDLDVHDEHRATIRTYDGFSTTAPIAVAFTDAVDGVALEVRTTETNISGTALRIDTNEHAIVPDLPLAPRTRYAVAVARGAVQASLQSLALMLGSPVYTDASTVRILSDARAAAIEPQRMALRSYGNTTDLAALFPFTTLDAHRTLNALRDVARTTSATPIDVAVDRPGLLGLGLAMPAVDVVVTGQIPSLDVPPIAFLLTIPKNVGDQPIPVVLTGHGLAASRDAVETWANGLAEAGFAALAIDLPYHGDRSTGLPVLSSLDFINLEDLVQTRDNFLQATIDLGQAVRTIREADWPSLIGHRLDGDDIVFLGTSLGGMLGASLAGVEPAIGSYALNVPGANLVELILQSEQAVLAQMLERDLERRGITRDTAAFHRYMASAKWTMDAADPINLVPRDGSRRLLIQMVQGDQVIPNVTTEQLAGVSGTAIEIFDPPVLGHAFLANPVSPEGLRAQAQIVTFFEGR